jgi:DNA-binding NarL/FixJ family response regulator
MKLLVGVRRKTLRSINVERAVGLLSVAVAWSVGVAFFEITAGAAILLVWSIVKTLQSGPQDGNGDPLKNAGDSYRPAVALVPVSKHFDPTLEEALEEKVRIYRAHEELPSGINEPSPVILCPREETLAAEVRRLRALFSQAPIVVFARYADANLAQEAFQMGANGFIHAQMTSEQILRTISTASRNNVVIPREVLEAFLNDMTSREDLRNLTTSQRRMLEQLAQETADRSEYVMPKEFTEAFLVN